jgi:hypothetical protein
MGSAYISAILDFQQMEQLIEDVHSVILVVSDVMIMVWLMMHHNVYNVVV